MPRATSVDGYIDGADAWHDELVRLRGLLLACGLDETIKWGAPCYTTGGVNIVGLAAFKGYVGLWFYNGAAMADPDGVLINAQSGKTKSLRQWRFGSLREIKAGAVKRYVNEAKRLGAPPPPRRSSSRVDVPAELQAALAADAKAKKAFEALTPGRRREYASHVGEAKRESTRVSRAEKVLPMILAGRGLHDRYRS